MPDPTVNFFDPGGMAWLGAQQGAMDSLGGIAPVSTLAGAGLGALLSPKHRWRGAAIGGGLGLLGGVGIPAGLNALDLHDQSQRMLDETVAGTHRQLAFPEATAETPDPAPVYANRTFQRTVYDQARPLLSGKALEAFNADYPTRGIGDRFPFSAFTPGPGAAEARVGMAQKAVLRDAYKQYGGFPLSSQDVGAALGQAQQNVLSHVSPELAGKGNLLAAALAAQYGT